jgi:catalase
VKNYQRDGFMTVSDNGGNGPNYYPNSFQGPAPQPRVAEPVEDVSGQASRHPYSHPNDDFFQAGELYRRVLTDEERDDLIGNITGHLAGAQQQIQERQTAIFYKADPDYGLRVAEGLGLDAKKVESLAALPQEELTKT